MNNWEWEYIIILHFEIMGKLKRICTECSCEEIEKVGEKRDGERNLVMEMFCCKYCGMFLPDHVKPKEKKQ